VNDVDHQQRSLSKERGAFRWGIAGWHEGIAWREAGRARDTVLVHGLGMSSAYFRDFARELFAAGRDPVAPDLRGFGHSENAAAMSPEQHAAELAAWADHAGIRHAQWIGHSTGCAVIAALAVLRPDLVRDPVYIGALWSRTHMPTVR